MFIVCLRQALVDLVLVLLRVYDSLASIFSTCWLIAGGVFVYGASADGVEFYDVESAEYCDHAAFVFAFVVVTIGFVSLGVSMAAAVCACACRRSKGQ